ncbi:carboxylesterase/lipase family protein [Treponema primitia]|nr:carboxylesterase family protein [Treponema primitia]
MKKKLLTACVILVTVGSFVFAKGSAEQGKSIPTAAPEMPIVKVAGGQLKGFVEGDGTLAFTGIRYAVAERFGKPQPVPAWQGIKPAQVYGPNAKIPVQTAVGGDEFAWPHRYYIESEDCQYLNIWTQSLSSSADKPVMVFIHGGGFNNGSAIEAVAYEGGNLSKFGDVVVVTVNHRLNVLGYLDLSGFGDAYKETANLGQLDLVAALQWVKDNIAQFGGNPNNVTIFGQSGGSQKVQVLMHMPAAKGLFVRAIGHSGAYTILTKQQADRVGQLTVQKLGLTQATIDQIKTIDYNTLLAAGVAALADAGKELNVSLSWRAVADNNVVQDNYPDWANTMPFMQGSVFSEITNHNLPLIDQGIYKNDWTTAETDSYLTKRFGSDAAAIKDEFTKLFPEKKPQDVFFYDIGRFRRPSQDHLADKAKTATAPVYTYLFVFEAPANGGITAFHCSELIYVFHNVGLREITKATGGTADVYKMQDIMAQAWVNFATNGNPSQPGLDWKPYDPIARTGTMIFDANSRFVPFNDSKLQELMGTR